MTLLAFYAKFLQLLLLLSSALAIPLTMSIPITTTFAQPYGSDYIPGNAGGPPACNSHVPDGRSLKISGNASISFFGDNNNNNDNDGSNPTNTIANHASLNLRLFDPITNQTMGGVTYYLHVTKANSNSSSSNSVNNNNNQTVLDMTIVSYPGPLVLNIEPSEVGNNKKVNDPVFLPAEKGLDAPHGPIFPTYRNGTITVQDSALLEKGLSYFAHVEVYGVNAGNMNLCPDAVIPKGDFSWTINNNNSNLVAVPEFSSTMPLILLVLGLTAIVCRTSFIRHRVP